MIFLLDTTVLIDALRGRQVVSVELADLVTQGHVLATTALNIGEVYAGMLPHETARTEELFRSLECYPVSAAIGRRAGALKNEHARRGKTLSLADMIVAATALEHDLLLMTDNRKDFPIAELRFHPSASSSDALGRDLEAIIFGPDQCKKSLIEFMECFF